MLKTISDMAPEIFKLTLVHTSNGIKPKTMKKHCEVLY